MTVRRILFVSKGINASTRYRSLQYFPYMQAVGFLPKHSTISGGVRAVLTTLWQAKQADVVIVLRKTFPTALTCLLRLVSKKLIFDLDDAIFCNSNGSPSKTRMSRFMAMASRVDHVFAGNQFLAEKSLTANKAVSLIPTSLDVAKYVVTVDKPADFVDLVWIGSRSTSKYLYTLLPILDKAVKKIPNLRLKIIADFDIENSQIPVIAIPWSEAAEASELASSHIGIAPMIDNDWTRGKCALKVLQYMAAKLPVISSQVGVNAQAIVQGETGYLVSSDDEWLTAIESLAHDQALREECGRNGLQRVKQIYDIDVVAQQILTVLK
jgi:glycosyltransferase involved in cell wall biosynthesis